MGIRYVNGPTHSGVYSRPDSAANLADPVVSLGYKGHRKGAPGKIHVDLSLSIPPFDPTAHNQLVEVHAIAYAADETIPADPIEKINSTNPKVKVDSGIPTDGSELVLTVPHTPIGAVIFATVLGFAEDQDQPDPGQAQAPETAPDAPTTVTSDPVVSPGDAVATDQNTPLSAATTETIPADPAAPVEPTTPDPASVETSSTLAPVVDQAPGDTVAQDPVQAHPQDPASAVPTPASDPAPASTTS